MNFKFLSASLRIIAIVAVSLLQSHVGSSQIISTIAGNRTLGYSGDGGLATNAEFYDPVGLATDTSGNIYIADFWNSCIRKVTQSGVISTFAGNGSSGFSGDGHAATAAEFYNPTGIALDKFGNVFVADQDNNRIRKISPSGIISTVAGSPYIGSTFSGDGGPATLAALNNPRGVATDTAGNIYIADYSNSCIRKVTNSGTISTIAGMGTVSGYSGDGGAATAALLNMPTDVAITTNGILYISDQGNNRIRKVSPSGIISTIAGTGTAGYFGDGGPATAALLNNPYDIAIDTIGNLYIADENNHCVRKVSLSGTIITFAGSGTEGYNGDGGPATAADLFYPDGVCVDNRGYVYISDFTNNVVRMVDTCMFHATAAISGTDLICQGASVTLTDATTGGSWSSSTPSVATIGISGIVNGISTGYATISYAVANTCGDISTATSLISVITVPYAGTITGQDSLCPGDTITLHDRVSGGSWNSSNTSVTSVTGTGLVTGLSGGADIIGYIVTNSCGSDTATFPFTVRPISECPNGVSKISNPTTASILVFPNPTQGSFTVTLTSPTNGPAQITITNMLGEKVKECVVPTNKESELQLNTQPGIYFISAVTNNETLTEKIVLE